jgi:hypothetical protein
MDPAAGRFVSEDPARDGVNWFAYASSNPVNMVDRTGKIGTSEDTEAASAVMNIIAGAQGGPIAAAMTIAMQLRHLVAARAQILMEIAMEAPGSARWEVLFEELEANSHAFSHLGSVLNILQPGAPSHVNPPPFPDL